MDDKLKQALLPAVVVFNLTLATIMAVRVVYPMLISNKALRPGVFYSNFALGAAIGVAAAAVTFAILMLRKR